MEYVEVMFPIILLVLTGLMLRYLKLIDSAGATGLNVFLFNCAIPALIFLAVATTPIEEIFNWSFVFSYFLVTAIIFLLTFFVFKVLVKSDVGVSAMAAFCVSSGNSGLIALPILIGLFGVKASIPIAIAMLIFVLILMPILSFLMEYAKGGVAEGNLFLKALAATIKNPFVLAGIFGFIFSLFSIPLPSFFFSYLHFLGQATVGCALIVIGVGLHGVKFSGKITEVVLNTFACIAIKPVLALFFAVQFELSPLYTTSLLVCSAVPTAKSAYIYAKKYHVYEEETAAIIFLGTICSVVTLPFYLWLAS